MIGIPKAARALRVDANDPASLQTALTEFDTRLKRLEELGRQSSNGQAVPSGLLVRGRRLLTGSGLYEPTPGTLVVTIRMVGGGAGGGGTGGAGISTGAGGSSGTSLNITLSLRDGTPITGGRYSCGAGGAGGSSPGAAGANGSSTTFELLGITLTAGGGGGGSGATGTAGDQISVATSPIAGTTSSNDIPNKILSFLTSTFEYGENGTVLGGASWVSGRGGSSPFGAGGIGVGGTSAGQPGTGYGSGGSGSSSQISSQIGGAGAPGCIMIEELG